MAYLTFNRHHFVRIAGIALGGLALGTALLAQTSQTPSPAADKGKLVPPSASSSTEKPFSNLVFNRHYVMSSDFAKGDDFIYTRGDAVTTGDHGHFKQIDKKTHEGILDANGNLVYDDPQHHATCDKAHIDMTTKLAIFTENVVLVLKPDKAANAPAPPPPPPSGAASAAATDTPPDKDVQGQKRHGVTVTCDRMEDQYKKKFIKLYGHLVFKQKFVDTDGKTVERTMTAEHAEYNGKSEIMVLFGPVDGHDSKGQEFHTTTDVTVGTKEGDENIEGIGPAKIIFLPQDDSEDNSDADTDVKTNADVKPKKDTGGKDTGTKGKQ
jgi:lipopolysaccharide export system protein LptA